MTKIDASDTTLASGTDAGQMEAALVAAGLEVFRTQSHASGELEIQVAERVRLHLMDSGIRVLLRDQFHVCFTARSQESEFPETDAAGLVDLVRNRVGQDAVARGYGEVKVERVDVTDPVDDSKVLDVWHEVRYERAVESLEAAVEEVRWALSIDKYISG